MLTRYDPERAPDPARWLATDEQQRIDIVRRYHRRAGLRIAREMAHAAIQEVVETQVAMGDETPAAETLQRLMAEGLSRHDALHAVGSVLIGHMNDILQADEDPGPDVNETYFRELRELTAEKWLQSGDDEDLEDAGLNSIL